jgi:hypothetical protein
MRGLLLKLLKRVPLFPLIRYFWYDVTTVMVHKMPGNLCSSFHNDLLIMHNDLNECSISGAIYLRIYRAIWWMRRWKDLSCYRRRSNVWQYVSIMNSKLVTADRCKQGRLPPPEHQ